jgi:hypothetical protein
VLVVDHGTGECVTSDGASQGRYSTSGGKVPTRALLQAAKALGCRRVFLTGPKPVTVGWMDENAGEEWRQAGHFYKLRDPCGRWTHADGWAVEVRRAAAWFGEGSYTAAQAVEGFRGLHRALQDATGGLVGLLASPAATGQSLWATTLRDGQVDEQTAPEVAALIRATSPQHREEVMGRCFDDCTDHLTMPRGKLPEVIYSDGIFMYASCVRELGTGPAIHLNSERLSRAFLDANPMSRARFLVNVTIPSDWAGPGLLPVKHENGRNWHYPSARGWQGSTWVDGAELHVALKAGWTCDPVEMIRYVEGKRPADTFVRKVLDLRADAPDLVSKGLRSMFIRTIGAWHSIGRERTYRVPLGEELPADVTEWDTFDDGTRVYTRSQPLTGNAAAFARPELSSQVWARARAKVTRAMLTVDPASIVAVWGDAMYLSTDPGWNGTKPGEFRAKGRLVGPVTRPKTIGELLKLRAKMGDV